MPGIEPEEMATLADIGLPKAGVEMPRYKCHKEVHALKIASITDPNNVTDGSRLLSFVGDGYAPLCVTEDFIKRHRPEVGGYYIAYSDGYTSFSPAQPFEEGYTLIA